MKYIQVSIIMMALFFSGCNALLGDREYKSGIVDYRMVKKKGGKDSIIIKFFDFNYTEDKKESPYFEDGDYIDIRLANIMYNDSFDPSWGEENKNKLINNIGVFVTINEIMPTSDLNDTIYPDKTLVYMGNMYVKAKANQSFTPMYLAKYHGGDLQLQIDVVEFDNKDKDSNRYVALLDDIVKLSQNAISNGLIGKAVNVAGKHYLGMRDINKLGNSLLNSFSNNHDDLITTYKLNLISSKTVKHLNQHKLPYLKEGDIVFVRRVEGDKNNEITKWKQFNFNTKTKVIEEKYKEEGKTDEKLFKEFYSYIVITLLKRDFNSQKEDSNLKK